MQAFPAGLPPPLAAGFSQTPAAGMLRSNIGEGHARQRRRFRELLTKIDLSWPMSGEQVVIFRAWFANDIARGTGWFTIPLVLDVGERTVKGQFADKEPSYVPFVEDGNWLVSASLMVIDKPDLAAVQATVNGVLSPGGDHVFSPSGDRVAWI